MNRALVRDFQQPLLLIGAERSRELDLQVDVPDRFALALAVHAVFGVNALVRQTHEHVLERPLLLARVHAERHRSAGAERRQQQRVRVRALIGAAHGVRFVDEEEVSVSGHPLQKRGSAATHRDLRYERRRATRCRAHAAVVQ